MLRNILRVTVVTQFLSLSKRIGCCSTLNIHTELLQKYTIITFFQGYTKADDPMNIEL